MNSYPLAALALVVACGGEAEEAPAPVPPATDFERDLSFLRERDADLVVLENGPAALIASAKYQGKVFTSTTGAGESQGYVNYEAFDVSPPAPHINAYGGEQRLWLGPEGGRQAIFFAPGADFDGEAWQTPPPLDHEPWEQVAREERAVEFAKRARFRNRAGETFDARIGRRVSLLTEAELSGVFGEAVEGLAGVGYVTDNSLTNAGAAAWEPASGTVSLWALDMLPAGDSVAVVLPVREGGTGVVDTTNAGYFGPTPPSRLRVVDGAVLLRGDGAEVGKVGLPPKHATGRLGSVDLARAVLTVIDYDLDAEARYQGMEWRELDDPYAGDAVTSYNHGAAPGEASFFELESVGPAAFLAPGETATHRHAVYHFTGPTEAVAAAAERLLGVDVATVRDFLAGGAG